MPSRFFGRVVLPDVVTTVNLASSSQLVLASAALSISSTGLGADYDEEEEEEESQSMMTVQVRAGHDQEGSPWLTICTLSASMELQWPLAGLVFDGDLDGLVSFRATGVDSGVVHLTGHTIFNSGAKAPTGE